MDGLQVDSESMARNLSIYGPFASVERILMALGRAGADRQVMHERLRLHAMKAWGAIKSGQANPLLEMIMDDGEICRYLSEDELQGLMDASDHLGDASARACALSDEIRSALV
jgi:adenylosuccinate lyase